MSEPIQRDGQWWTQAEDGSWLRWNAAAYRCDPQPGPPAGPVLDGPPVAGAPDATPPAPEGAVAAPAPATSAMRDFEPTDGKARVAIALLGVSAAVAAVRAPLLFARAADRSSLVTTNRLLIGLTTVSSLVFLGALIALLVWFKAAYDNLEPLGATGLRYSPGWAIGGWFIPIGNFIIPKQLTNDMWRASDPKLPVDMGSRWKHESVASVVHVWWASWLLRAALTVASGAAERVAIENKDISGVQTAVNLAAVSELLLVVAGVTLIIVVKTIAARQVERAATIAASSPERARALGIVGP